MLHLKAVDDVIRFRVRGSSFHNTDTLSLTSCDPMLSRPGDLLFF